ncbi:MAG: hypothetical protein V3T53_09760 [Phycisphaerales bacterium]
MEPELARAVRAKRRLLRANPLDFRHVRRHALRELDHNVVFAIAGNDAADVVQVILDSGCKRSEAFFGRFQLDDPSQFKHPDLIVLSADAELRGELVRTQGLIRAAKQADQANEPGDTSDDHRGGIGRWCARLCVRLRRFPRTSFCTIPRGTSARRIIAARSVR